MIHNATNAVKQLFYINVIMFILTLFYLGIINYIAMYDMNSDPFAPYQLITHQFLHGGFLHIIFNMIVLLSFAPSVESTYGYKKFLIYYLLCGIGGGLLHSLMNPMPIVGASGAIWGIMVIFTFMYPNEKMYIFFIPYGIRAKYIISVLFVYEVISGLFLSPDGTAHFGHVGGALMGALIYLYNKFTTPRLKYKRYH
jgi:membrane associated rhomboid family serine protease